MKFQRAVILPTLSCNVDCRHCIVDKPKTHTAMPDSLLERLLDDLSGRDSMKSVLFSGGEPLQAWYVDRLLGCIENSGIGKEKTIESFTNAVWAKDYKHAREMAERLKHAGFFKINISTDKYHRKFVPLEYVANAIRALRDESIGANVVVRSFRPTIWDEMVAVFDLSRMLGQELKDLTYTPMVPNKKIKHPTLKSCSQMGLTFGEKGYNFTAHFARGDVTEGNAAKYLDRKDMIDKLREGLVTKELVGRLKIRGCYEGRSPQLTIMPNGNMLPCCMQLNSGKGIDFAIYPQTSIDEFEKMVSSGPMSHFYFGRWKRVAKVLADLEPNLDKEKLRMEIIVHEGKDRILDPCETCIEMHRGYCASLKAT